MRLAVRTSIRVLVVAASAAVLALAARDFVARRLSDSLSSSAREASDRAAEMLPSPHPMALPILLPPAPTPLEDAGAPGQVFVPVPPKAAPGASPKKAPRAAPSTSPTVSREEVEKAIETRLGGASAVVTRDSDGDPIGLKLSGVSKLARFGVRDGDVLVGVNGMPLRTAEEAFAALSKLQGEKKAVFTLRRGDAQYVVPVEVQ